MSPHALWRLAIMLAAAASMCALLACFATASRANTPGVRVEAKSIEVSHRFWEARGETLSQCWNERPVIVYRRMSMDTYGWTYFGDCKIRMNNRWQWRTRQGKLEFCATLAHEEGHDLYFGHTDDLTGEPGERDPHILGDPNVNRLMQAYDDGYIPRICYRVLHA